MLLRSLVSRMGCYHVKLYRGQDIGEVKKVVRDRELWDSEGGESSAFAAVLACSLLCLNEAQERMAADSQSNRSETKFMHEKVRSLEQQETGEIGRLRCADCGQQWFESWEQLRRHQLVCRRNETEKAEPTQNSRSTPLATGPNPTTR